MSVVSGDCCFVNLRAMIIVCMCLSEYHCTSCSTVDQAREECQGCGRSGEVMEVSRKPGKRSGLTRMEN